MIRRPSTLTRALAACLSLALLAALPAPALAQVPDFEKHANGPNAFAHAKDPENCVSCHHAEPPLQRITAEDEVHDVVVVGAGIAGLTTTWRLRDLDVVLLDKDARAGGKMTRKTWEGIQYSDGPAYFVDNKGEVKELLDDLKLAPIPVPETTNAVMIGGKIYCNPWTTGVDALPYTKDAKERLKRAFKEVAAMSEEIAVPARHSSERLIELDRKKALDFVEPYGEEMKAILATYIRSCFGVEPDELSALGFLNFFAAEFGSTFSFPGGLAAVTEALAEGLDPKKLRFGCYVTEVAATKEGVRIVYRDSSGKPRVIRAKVVVLTVPQFMACHMIKDLATKQPERFALMDSIYHGAYAVAAIKTNTPVHDGIYDTWFLDGALKDGQVTDVIVADWVARGGKPGDPKRKHVLTAYMPLGTAGRSDFLSKPIDDWKKDFVSQLTPRFPSLAKELVEVEVFLHGHGMHVTVPGYLTETAPRLGEPIDGKILFAGVELDLPQLESAVWSACRAARQARAVLKGEKIPSDAPEKEGAAPPGDGSEKAPPPKDGRGAPGDGKAPSEGGKTPGDQVAPPG